MSPWFQAVQTVGIIGSLLLSALAFRGAGRATRVANLFTLTAAHRDIWRRLDKDSALEYILDEGADPELLTSAQRRFLAELILHISSSFEASRLDALVPLEGLRRDVRSLMALPAPQAAWAELRHLQNREFRDFVDALLPAHI